MTKRYEPYRLAQSIYFSPHDPDYCETFHSWDDFINASQNPDWVFYKFVLKDSFDTVIQQLRTKLEKDHTAREVRIESIVVKIETDIYKEGTSYYVYIGLNGERLMTEKAAAALEKREKAEIKRKETKEKQEKEKELKLLKSLMKKYKNELKD